MRQVSMTFSLAVGALLAWSVPGIAAEPRSSAQGSSPQEIFKKLDKNNDGKLTKEEVGEERVRFFDRLLKRGDQNHDGLLSRNEFQEVTTRRDRPVSQPQDRRGKNRREGDRRRPNPDQFFQRFDKNNDGKLTLQEFPEKLRDRVRPMFKRLGKDSITKAEFAKLHKRGGEKGRRDGKKGPREGNLFQKFDRNNDGKLTLQEFPEKLRDRVRPMFKRLGKDSMTKEDFAKLRKRGGEKGRRDGKGKRGRAGGQSKGRNVGEIVARIFSRADKNGDGKISRNEAPSRMKERFDNMDANGDGGIDKGELKRQFEKHFKNRDGGQRRPDQNRKKRKRPRRRK